MKCKTVIHLHDCVTYHIKSDHDTKKKQTSKTDAAFTVDSLQQLPAAFIFSPPLGLVLFDYFQIYFLIEISARRTRSDGNVPSCIAETRANHFLGRGLSQSPLSLSLSGSLEAPRRAPSNLPDLSHQTDGVVD